MATIHDVAKKAGVAPITVSRVINNTGYVSEHMRAKVNKAIDELGYVPNVLARSLKSKRTNTLALVFTDITNPFFNFLARGVEDSASNAGFNVIVCNTDESQEQEDQYIQLMLQKQVDGILLVPAESDSRSINLIHEQKTPLVILDRRVPSDTVDIVRCDSEGGAYQMTEYLIDLGHERISLLSGPQKVSTAQDRVLGYKRAMQAHGLQRFINFQFGKFTTKSGAEQLKSVFSKIEQPTAIFAANNLIAIGALLALREMDIRVPEDVAVVCFDSIPENLTAIPFLTAINQPSYEIGQKATELLISRILHDQHAPQAYQEIVLPIEMVIRESSGSKISYKKVA